MIRHRFTFSQENRLVLMFTAILIGSSMIIRFCIHLLRGEDTWSQELALILMTAFVILIFWAAVRNLRSLPPLAVIIIGPFAATLADMVHTEIYFLTIRRTFSWIAAEFTWESYVYNTYLGSLIYLTWFLGYFAIVNYTRFKQETLAVTEARTKAHQAQLQMLRYQINPHFLFNTLNSISALVLDKKNHKAETMVGSLSRFLRFSLEKNPEAKITLEEEISIIKEYLSIEKIRYVDKITAKFDLQEETLDCLVPGLILQPAIENAIKHAIAPHDSNGIITISSRIKDDQLYLNLTDTGPGLTPTMRADGVGVDNMRKRLFVMYGDAGTLDLRNGSKGGAEVVISIPIEREDNDNLEKN